jgi:hypothetical protein
VGLTPAATAWLVDGWKFAKLSIMMVKLEPGFKSVMTGDCETLLFLSSLCLDVLHPWYATVPGLKPVGAGMLLLRTVASNPNAQGGNAGGQQLALTIKESQSLASTATSGGS